MHMSFYSHRRYVCTHSLCSSIYSLHFHICDVENFTIHTAFSYRNTQKKNVSSLNIVKIHRSESEVVKTSYPTGVHCSYDFENMFKHRLLCCASGVPASGACIRTRECSYVCAYVGHAATHATFNSSHCQIGECECGCVCVWCVWVEKGSLICSRGICPTNQQQRPPQRQHFSPFICVFMLCMLVVAVIITLHSYIFGRWLPSVYRWALNICMHAQCFVPGTGCIYVRSIDICLLKGAAC